MDVKVVEREGLTLLGITARINPMEADYGALWAQFGQRAAEIGALAIAEGAYSAYFDTADPPMADFIGGMVVAKGTVAPEGLVVCDVAGGTYARVETTMDKIGEAWIGLYESWLPESGYLPDMARPGLEYYPPGEMTMTSPVILCVPVIAK